MLDCNLLLDSADQFGLKEGMCNFPHDAKNGVFLVSFVVFGIFWSDFLMQGIRCLKINKLWHYIIRSCS